MKDFGKFGIIFVFLKNPLDLDFAEMKFFSLSP